MAVEKRSYFWPCFWLALLFCVLSHVAADLDRIVHVIDVHAGEDRPNG